MKEKAPECPRAPVFGLCGLASAAPDVDGEEEEQPHNVHKVPVPSSRLKSDVTFLREMTALQTQQADEQEDRADQDVEAVETGRHEEGRAVNVTRKAERRVAVFVHLEEREEHTQSNRKDQAPFHVFPVVLVHQSVVRPSRCRTRAQQNQCVDQWQVKRVERFDRGGWPLAF